MIFELTQNSMGAWQLQLDEALHVGVTVVRAFPIGAPDEAVSVLSAEGHELLWLEATFTLPRGAKKSGDGQHCKRVNSCLKFSVWTRSAVSSRRLCGRCKPAVGPAQFVLRGEEDIRRLSGQTLIVADEHGVQFLIRDLPALDRHSRKLLDRFL